MTPSAIRIAIPLPARQTVRSHDPFSFVAPLLVSATATALLLAGSRHGWTQLQAVLAFTSLAFPCFAYAEWRRTRRSHIPLFAVLAAAHTVFYCVSVFWTDTLAGAGTGLATVVLAFCDLGISGLYLGMRMGAWGLRWRRVRLPDVPADRRNWTLIRVIAGCQVFVPFLPVGTGGDFRQEIAIVISFIPVVAFLILWDATLRGKGAVVDKVLVAVFLAASILAGLVTGWLGGCIGNLLLAAIGYLRVRRRVPVVPLGAVILIMLFLQGGKPAFRERFWYGDDNAGAFVKAKFWIAKSAERLTLLARQPGGGWHEALEPLLARSSVVGESATVYQNTPSLVPYQHGATYRYLLVTLIPRFMWPGKPSVNDANRFYQLAYGVTLEQDLDHVAIGAGLIPEAYMNFGWAGIPIVMCLAGVILGIFERIFLWRDTGVFASALGLAYVLQLLSLNGQAAAYFGGMIQIVGLTMAIFLPALCFRKPSRQIAWRVRAHGGAAA